MNQLQTQLQSGHEELNLVKMPKQSNQNITFASQGSDLNQLQSKINSRSEEFKNNQATMLNLVQDLQSGNDVEFGTRFKTNQPKNCLRWW